MGTEPDVKVENHGTIVMFQPMTIAASHWMGKALDHAPFQWIGDALAVDHRYAEGLTDFMVRSGLNVAA